jgi:hypothetical protein
MERHEIEARIDAQVDEWKRNLDALKAKADSSHGQADVAYRDALEPLQKQFDALKIQAAAAHDAADDSWDSVSSSFETSWNEWQDRAKRVWDEASK